MRRFWKSTQAALILCIPLMLCSVAFGKVLSVPPVVQEQELWCWAGVSASVLAYYGQSIEQCTIAEYTRTHADWYDFGSVDCCVGAGQGCNHWNYNWGHPGSIEDILLNWGVESTKDGNPLSQNEVTNQINSDRPFIIRWAWASGGGHFLVGRGIESDIVHYIDPLPGEGLKSAAYDWVVSGNNHTWTHTQRMTSVLEEGHKLTGEWVVSPSVKCGRTCKLRGTLRIENNGNGDALPSYVHFYLTNGFEDFPLRSTSIAGIQASTSKLVKLKVTFPPNALGMFLVAFIDPNEETPEPDEENNLVIFGPIR